MNRISIGIALAALAVGGAAQAQSCPCNGGVGTLLTSGPATQAVLSNKMVCAQVGNEQWQEWHNGGSSGPVVDYKLGPGVQPDPSTTVGTYVINTNGSVTYTYGSGGGNYTYAVCSTGGSYAFCGAAFGGRDILGALVSPNPGLQSCTAVKAAVAASTRSSRASATVRKPAP